MFPLWYNRSFARQCQVGGGLDFRGQKKGDFSAAINPDTLQATVTKQKFKIEQICFLNGGIGGLSTRHLCGGRNRVRRLRLLIDTGVQILVLKCPLPGVGITKPELQA